MVTSSAMEQDDGPEYNVQGLGCSLEFFAETAEMKEALDNLKETAQDDKEREILYQKISTILGYYQEQPHMLDPHLTGWMSRLVDAVLAFDGRPESDVAARHAHAAAYIAQQIIKVRGYKIVVRHLPHETHHVEAVLKLLETQNEHKNWETNYFLLLWMSILVLIPFHLARFEQQVMERILGVVKRYLSLHNKCQNAAAYLAAKFLTRPEIVKEGFLAQFLDWTAQTLLNTKTTERDRVGALLSVAAIFKHGTRADLLPHAGVMLEVVTNPDLNGQRSGAAVRKLVTKTIQRIGLTFLKAKVATWRYQRGSRSLAINLTGSTKEPAVANSGETMDESEEEYDVPEQTEEVIEQLLTGLRSGETIIRWSAAKGIGRVTARLPKDLADEVLCSILQLFSLRESDGAWHGGCLAVAELSRRGLLLPSRLPEVVAVCVEKASVFDERRGNFSVGSHVRDAACYVAWSLARAFGPEIMAQFTPKIATALLTVAVFDREVNCRRAASAAFQENVGRQGGDCLPSAIDILTTVDYFAVGSRQACFTRLAPQLAKHDLELYGRPLIGHLLDHKVGHWDSAVRELTAAAFNEMCDIAPDEMINRVLPSLLDSVEKSKDLFVRHGSILAIGQLVLGMSRQPCALEESLGPAYIERIKGIVSGLESRMALRGSGGEIVRTAVTCFISNMAEAKFPCHTDQDVIELWKISLDDNLSSADPLVQEKAVNASTLYVGEYCRRNPDSIVNHYLSNMHETELTRRGYCMALGALPKFALSGRLDDILPSLIACTSVQNSAEEKWAEGRRDAVKAITNIVKTFGVESGAVNGSECVCEANIVMLYDCYLTCMDDYTVDRRGDTGAWVREAAMTGIVSLTLAANKKGLVPEVCVAKMMTKLAQQSVEKIDRTRGHAAKSFATILSASPPVPAVPNQKEVKALFPTDDIESFGWTVESETFPIFTQLLQFPAYKERVLLGLVVSVGGLAERLVMQASAAFFRQVEAMSSAELTDLCGIIIRILESNHKTDRIVVPMFKFLDRLLTSGHLEAVLDDPQSSFGLDLFNLIKKEVLGCGEPNKLLYSADVFCALLQVADPVAKQKCLVQLCIFLCHKFPIIRKSTSSKLFEALLTHSTVVEDDEMLDQINTILSDTTWDVSPVETLRPIRNSLCDLLGIPAPAVVKKPV